MNIICISGKAQHGKDTTAGMIKKVLNESGYSVLIAHYADLLKYICRQFFGWDGKKDSVGRKLLQYVGTDVVRAKRPTYWVDFLVGFLDLFDSEWDYVLIPDCRFPNEVETMKNSKFPTLAIRISRPDFVSPLTEEQQKHPSETAMDNFEFDSVICNNGTLEDLQNEVVRWIGENLYEKTNNPG